jgi:NAD(P)-dependent dehydrogenase (short-subunit alcohol dehydrogenase family)
VQGESGLQQEAVRGPRAHRLDGKVALVTGVGSGIGQAIAFEFLRQGARVLGADINSETAAASAVEAADEGYVLSVKAPLDVRDPEAVRELVEWAAAEHGQLDVLVNTAARFVGAVIEEMDFETHWRGTLASELDSVFLMCQAAWPHLVARGGGSIINFASVNAWQAIERLPSLVHAAGKAGVLGMTRELAKEGAAHGIRANTLSPGMVVTAATRRFLDTDAEYARIIREQHMLKRFGTPQDIAWPAVFLASDEARWVTGADFRIDGGWSAW